LTAGKQFFNSHYSDTFTVRHVFSFLIFLQVPVPQKNPVWDLSWEAEHQGYKGTFGEAHFRNRRGILELAGAIRCTTGRSPFAYLRYGCYCGLGGRGWPKDRVDWCCFNHDCCYGKAEQAGCHPKIESYHWECEDNAAVCESLEDKCQKMACECDREAAKCFSKAPYHTKHLLWPDFMCGEIQPLCRY
uniref:Phospholipase A2 n=4 Tax=Accipitrinae TaxID=8955 RepID=A0A8B9MP00_9AVES